MQKLNKSDIKSIANITLRLFAVCTVIALLVAGVNFITKDRITAYEIEKRTEALNSVFMEGDMPPKYERAEAEISGSVTDVYTVYVGDELIGYGVLCSPVGFKDSINMLVAFDKENSIKSVKIISLSETKGIGDKVISDKSFVKQFEGKKNSIIAGDDGIDVIARSTVSSKAVVKGVNDAISVIKIYTSSDTEGVREEVLTNE